MSLFADVLTEAVRQRGEARRKDHDVAVAAWKRFEAAVLDGASQRPLAAADVEVPQVSLRQLREIIGDEVPRRLPTARAARAAGARDGAAGAAAAQTRNRRESGGNVGSCACFCS